MYVCSADLLIKCALIEWIVHARLALDLERIERELRRARAQGESTFALAQERAAVQVQLSDVVSRMEGTL